MAKREHPTGHEPLNRLKPVASDLWLVDGPAVSRRGIAYPTRCTIVRLADGGLWVHSPTPLTPALRAELGALGPVRHLVAAGRLHPADIGGWQDAYPDAGTYDAPSLGHHPDPATDISWADQIYPMPVRGSTRHRETVFFHRASATLIVSDLIQNLETAHLPVRMRPLVWLAGIDDSDGKMPPLMRLSFRKSELAASIEAMIDLGPERLILAHGRWYSQDAADELRRAFRSILRDREWSAALAAKRQADRHQR